MRDGKYDIICGNTGVGDLIEKVNKAMEDDWTPQAQPFVHKGMICQTMTKVECKPMTSKAFGQELARRGIESVSYR